MNYHNPYARIQEYFALLSASMNFTDSSDNGKSMQQICESKQIPVKIVRNDFLTIFQWQRMELAFGPMAAQYEPC